MIPISEKLTAELNAQIARELGNRLLYKHFASWAHVRGLKNIEKFFSGQADGEMGHAKLISDLLSDGNVQIAIPAIEGKPSTFESCEQIAGLYVEAEGETTEHLESIYFSAEEEKAIGVSNLLQGMLQEQVEEEGLADRFSNLVGIAAGNLILLDVAVGNIA